MVFDAFQTSMDMTRVFVAYAREDRRIAAKINQALVDAGYKKVFFDTRHLPPSSEFNRKIQDEIRQTDLFLFLVSPNSIRSGCYAQTELRLAQKRWPSPVDRVLAVPVGEISREEFPPYLASSVVLDVGAGDLAAEVLIAVDKMASRVARKNARQALSALVLFAALAALVGLIVLPGYLSNSRTHVKSDEADSTKAAPQQTKPPIATRRVSAQEYKQFLDEHKMIPNPFENAQWDLVKAGAIVRVNWSEAIRFCESRGKRLPSEDEWLAQVSKDEAGSSDLREWTRSTANSREAIVCRPDNVGSRDRCDSREIFANRKDDLSFRCVP